MRTGKQRKLITIAGYYEFKRQTALCVPLTKIIKNMELEISRPTLLQLSGWMFACEKNLFVPVWKPALVPEWLDQDGPYIQEASEGWYFEGDFPHNGTWEQK